MLFCQHKSGDHVAAGERDAPKIPNINFKGIGGDHKTRCHDACEAFLLLKLLTCLLHALARRLVLGAMDDLVITGAVANRVTACASQELGAGDQALRTAIAQRPAAEWLALLDAAGIPAGPINRVSQALSDVQAQHRAMVRALGGARLVGSPVRIDGTRADSDLPPPALGEHTDGVLGELGIARDRIERLKAAGVVG